MIIKYLHYSEFKTSQEEKKQFKELFYSISKTEKKKISSINIILCNDEFIRSYNKEYLNHDYETDIITFHDSNDEEKIEGELLISTDTVKSNSKKYKVSFENELSRVLIHGVLHLCGYNDVTKNEKALMKKKENFYLKNI
ncbi:MAG: rRNA maturation RNase YbeY [Ignavibacteria bacterium]|nr:rRNA maturation RNase YbeY [Ignavibacteria bacterium]